MLVLFHVFSHRPLEALLFLAEQVGFITFCSKGEHTPWRPWGILSKRMLGFGLWWSDFIGFGLWLVDC